MKVCILGNCQAQHLEMMIRTANPSVTVERLKPVFLMTEDDREQVYAALGAADVVFAQRIAQEFNLNWLASPEIKRSFGAKTVVWPNVYFDGLFPGIQYIYMKGRGKLVGPLGDYHFSQIASAHMQGRTVEEAVEAFSGEPIVSNGTDPVQASIDQLRLREAESDLMISDFIEENFSERRYFYTPNHPTNELLGQLLHRMGTHVGLTLDIDKAIGAPYRLDEIYVATSAAIVRKLNLSYDHDPIYTGRKVLTVTGSDVVLGPPERYGTLDLATAFYKLYDDIRGTSAL